VDLNQYLLFGTIGRPRGLRGAVVFWPFYQNTSILQDLKQLWVEQTLYQINHVRSLNQGYELKLQTIDTVEQAKQITLKKTYIERAVLPALEPGEYYIQDLLGLPVLNKQHQQIGVVKSLEHTPHQSFILLEYQQADQIKTTLLPIHENFIYQVHVPTHVIVQNIEDLLNL